MRKLVLVGVVFGGIVGLGLGLHHGLIIMAKGEQEWAGWAVTTCATCHQ